mmetsp:Transcript_111542/g.356021  ORF Transcript_111542/g.356021 Transcript_111542/m.356021 type:complete len:293 (-) Transcript_111542:114-992(-)
MFRERAALASCRNIARAAGVAQRVGPRPPPDGQSTPKSERSSTSRRSLAVWAPKSKHWPTLASPSVRRSLRGPRCSLLALARSRKASARAHSCRCRSSSTKRKPEEVSCPFSVRPSPETTSNTLGEGALPSEPPWPGVRNRSTASQQLTACWCRSLAPGGPPGGAMLRVDVRRCGAGAGCGSDGGCGCCGGGSPSRWPAMRSWKDLLSTSCCCPAAPGAPSAPATPQGTSTRKRRSASRAAARASAAVGAAHLRSAPSWIGLVPTNRSRITNCCARGGSICRKTKRAGAGLQ